MVVAFVALTLLSSVNGRVVAATSAKPAAGKACKASQVGTTSGALVCTKSGKAGVWRKAPTTTAVPTTALAPTTTVFDMAKAPAGTVLYSETFDDAAKSTWTSGSGSGWTADVRDGQFRLAAAPPAPGRVSTGSILTYPGRVEVAFDMTITPGALSKASPNLTCQDTGVNGPFNFLLIDIRPDGRLIAVRYDNASADQQPKTFFDRGFSNQDRFDPALIHARTRVALKCIRDGQSVQVTLSLDGKVVMDTTTPALTQAGDSFTFDMSTFTTGFRDAAELLIDNVSVTKV